MPPKQSISNESLHSLNSLANAELDEVPDTQPIIRVGGGQTTKYRPLVLENIQYEPSSVNGISSEVNVSILEASSFQDKVGELIEHETILQQLLSDGCKIRLKIKSTLDYVRSNLFKACPSLKHQLVQVYPSRKAKDDSDDIWPWFTSIIDLFELIHVLLLPMNDVNFLKTMPIPNSGDVNDTNGMDDEMRNMSPAHLSAILSIGSNDEQPSLQITPQYIHSQLTGQIAGIERVPSAMSFSRQCSRVLSSTKSFSHAEYLPPAFILQSFAQVLLCISRRTTQAGGGLDIIMDQQLPANVMELMRSIPHTWYSPSLSSPSSSEGNTSSSFHEHVVREMWQKSHPSTQFVARRGSQPSLLTQTAYNDLIEADKRNDVIPIRKTSEEPFNTFPQQWPNLLSHRIVELFSLLHSWFLISSATMLGKAFVYQQYQSIEKASGSRTTPSPQSVSTSQLSSQLSPSIDLTQTQAERAESRSNTNAEISQDTVRNTAHMKKPTDDHEILRLDSDSDDGIESNRRISRDNTDNDDGYDDYDRNDDDDGNDDDDDDDANNTDGFISTGQSPKALFDQYDQLMLKHFRIAPVHLHDCLFYDQKLIQIYPTLSTHEQSIVKSTLSHRYSSPLSSTDNESHVFAERKRYHDAWETTREMVEHAINDDHRLSRIYIPLRPLLAAQAVSSDHPIGDETPPPPIELTMDAQLEHHQLDLAEAARASLNATIPGNIPKPQHAPSLSDGDVQLASSPHPLYISGMVFDRLLPHQQKAVQWLSAKTLNNSGAILADEMGLGKSVQISALLSAFEYTFRLGYHTSPLITLLVVPASIIGLWLHELHLWVPNMRVFTWVPTAPCHHVGPTSAIPASSLSLTKMRRQMLYTCLLNQTPSVLVVSYSTLQSSLFESLTANVTWGLTIFDECQRASNEQTITYRKCLGLSSLSRILLTGTPIQNSLKDLWNLMSIAKIPHPGSFSMINDAIKKPKTEEDVRVAINICQLIRQHISSHILRRTKDKTVKLPPQTHSLVMCTMENRQCKIYNHFIHQLRASTRTKTGRTRRGGQTFRYLNSLLRICTHPDLVVPPEEQFPRYYQRLSRLDEFNNSSSATRGTAEQACRESIKRSKCGDIGGYFTSDGAVNSYIPGLTSSSSSNNSSGGDSDGPRMVSITDTCPCINEVRVEEYGSYHRSAKLDSVLRLICAWLCQGQKVTVFSSSVKALDMLSRHLRCQWYVPLDDVPQNQGGYPLQSSTLFFYRTGSHHWLPSPPYVHYRMSYSLWILYPCRLHIHLSYRLRIDGSTPPLHRTHITSLFNNGVAKILLASTKCVGEGVTLTNTDKVILLNCSWNPASDAQCISRTHRLGRTKPCSVFTTLVKGSLESYVIHTQHRKMVITNAILKGSKSVTQQAITKGMGRGLSYYIQPYTLDDATASEQQRIQSTIAQSQPHNAPMSDHFMVQLGTPPQQQQQQPMARQDEQSSRNHPSRHAFQAHPPTKPRFTIVDGSDTALSQLTSGANGPQSAKKGPSAHDSVEKSILWDYYQQKIEEEKHQGRERGAAAQQRVADLAEDPYEAAINAELEHQFGAPRSTSKTPSVDVFSRVLGSFTTEPDNTSDEHGVAIQRSFNSQQGSSNRVEGTDRDARIIQKQIQQQIARKYGGHQERQSTASNKSGSGPLPQQGLSRTPRQAPQSPAKTRNQSIFSFGVGGMTKSPSIPVKGRVPQTTRGIKSPPSSVQQKSTQNTIQQPPQRETRPPKGQSVPLQSARTTPSTAPAQPTSHPAATGSPACPQFIDLTDEDANQDDQASSFFSNFTFSKTY